MHAHGGFDHNEHSLRVVETLEESYPQHPGLNLSYEVLEGLRKHHPHFQLPQGNIVPSPSLEAQVANIADSIAYNNHDLDDGLESGLLDPDDLDQLAVWKRAQQHAFEELGSKTENRAFLRRCFMNHQVAALIANSRAAIEAAGVDAVEKVRLYPKTLIIFSQSDQEENQELRHFLAQHLEKHPTIATAHQEACHKIEFLFQHYLDHPKHLGHRYFNRIEADGKHRTVCDYIAGMTDRYVNLHYQALQ